jgi:putative transposase
VFPRHPRLPPTEYIGRRRYLLTFCCNYRQPYFADPENVDCARSRILSTASRENMAVTAYCFMPDYLHMVVTGLTDEADLLSFIKLVKQTTSFHFKRRRGTTLWQPGGHDSIIRRSDELTGAVSYVIDNPVRTRLVSDPSAYPFTGSQTMSVETLFRHSRHTVAVSPSAD